MTNGADEIAIHDRNKHKRTSVVHFPSQFLSFLPLVDSPAVCHKDIEMEVDSQHHKNNDLVTPFLISFAVLDYIKSDQVLNEV